MTGFDTSYRSSVVAYFFGPPCTLYSVTVVLFWL